MNSVQKQDFYEILEVSPNASAETIERMFRYFAQRYHPDRQETGDADRFRKIVEAYGTLKEPEKRAEYDSRHKSNIDYRWSLIEEAGDKVNFDDDRTIQERVLSILYTKRKRDPMQPGLGMMELERLTGCPQEVLDFHLWYLKDKGWIVRMENGFLAITVDGVDQALQIHQNGGTHKLVTQQP